MDSIHGLDLQGRLRRYEEFATGFIATDKVKEDLVANKVGDDIGSKPTRKTKKRSDVKTRKVLEQSAPPTDHAAGGGAERETPARRIRVALWAGVSIVSLMLCGVFFAKLLLPNEKWQTASAASTPQLVERPIPSRTIQSRAGPSPLPSTIQDPSAGAPAPASSLPDSFADGSPGGLENSDDERPPDNNQTNQASPENPRRASSGSKTAIGSVLEKSKAIQPLHSSPTGVGYVRLHCIPAGDFYLNDQLVRARSEVALLEVPGNMACTVTIRHPELFGTRSWSPIVSPGDTLELPPLEVTTGTLRVVCDPPGTAAVHLEGRETGEEAPYRKIIASGEHLVQVKRPGWVVHKVLVVDRTNEGDSREIVPADPASFPGVSVEIREGHDHKVIFSMGPALE
jgi:hypothetical protein